MTDVRDADLSDLLETPAARGDLAPAGAGHAVAGQRRRKSLGAPPWLQQSTLTRWRPLLFVVLCFLPTIVAGIYYGLIATDRYVSKAAFIVRTASKPAGSDGGLGAFLRMAGLGRSDDDTYSVKDFIESRDAVRELQARLPLAQMYGAPGTDFLSRFPSLLYGSGNEELFRYYTKMTTADYNASSGITTLQVQAFRPDDALAIATNVLSLAEDLVNHLNTRIREDAEVSASNEVKHEEKRLSDAQVALTAFQNKENMIDPTANSVIVSEIVGKLQADLAQTQARIADMQASSPNNPGLAGLRRQADVTRAQIDKESSRITSAQEGLADKLGTYQRLMLEREFATKALASATAALDSARTEARRKQLYIQRIVEPNLSDNPTLPRRAWTTFTVWVINCFTLFMGWMVSSGVREHVSSTR